MATPKFASLHPGLLARKGEARPAQPDGTEGARFTDDPVALTPVGQRSKLLKEARPAPAARPPTPVLPRNETEQDDDSTLDVKPMRKTAPRAKVSISARHRHLLQLVRVVKNRPTTAMVDDAVGAYLQRLAAEDMKNCGCFRRALISLEK